MRTFLAVIGAVVLIGGALFVRSTFLEDVDAVGDDGGDGGGAVTGIVACDAALGDGCPGGSQRLTLDVLLAELSGDPEVYDVLVAPSAVIDLIEQSQTTRVAFGDRRDVASTTAVVVVHGPRATAVDEACGADVTWGCVQQAFLGGGLRPGFADPTRSSEGLVALAALLGGHLGRSDYPANVFRDASFLTWIEDLGDAVSVRPDPVSSIVQFNGAQNDAAVTWEATGGSVAVRSAAPTETYTPSPITAVRIVTVGIGGTGGGDVDRVADAATAALGAAGWRGADGAPIGDGPPLADDDGLPSGGVLFSLRGTWR